MFDTYVIKRTETNYVPYEKTVIEKRAPTDESIKIWDEMQTKAYASIVDTIVVNDNTLNFKAVRYQDIRSFTDKVYWQMALNGKKIERDFELPRADNRRQFIDKTVEGLSKQISYELMSHLSQTGALK